MVEVSVCVEGGGEELDALERLVRRRREFYFDRAARMDGASADDDGHDACSRRLPAMGRVGEGGCHEAGAEAIHLDAGCTESGDFDDCLRPNMEAGGGGEGEQIDAGGGDVFAEVAGIEAKARAAEGFEEFCVEEVHLREVGLGRIAARPVAVAYGCAAVGVPLNAKAGEEVNSRLRLLAEGMAWAEADGDYTSRHQRGFRVRE